MPQKKSCRRCCSKRALVALLAPPLACSVLPVTMFRQQYQQTGVPTNGAKIA
jgi:hypothetical protein